MTARQRRAAKERVNSQLDCLAAEAYGRRVDLPTPGGRECELCGETYHGRLDCPECSEPA